MDLIEDETGQRTYLNLDNGIQIKEIPSNASIIYNATTGKYLANTMSMQRLNWTSDVRQAYPQVYQYPEYILHRMQNRMLYDLLGTLDITVNNISVDKYAASIKLAFGHYISQTHTRIPHTFNAFINYTDKSTLDNLKPLSRFEKEFVQFKAAMKEIESIKVIPMSSCKEP